MLIPNSSRLAQIKVRLGSTLKSLGLRPQLVPTEGGQGYLRFVSEDGSGSSPVNILVPDSRAGGWANCRLLCSQFTEYDVGDNGWKFFWDRGWTSDEALAAEEEEALAQIGKALEDAGVILKDGHPLKTTNEELFRAFEELEARLCLYEDGEIPIECRRENGIESLNLTDPCGQVWMIAFEEGKAIIQADGEDVEILPSKEAYKISRAVSRRIDEAVLDRQVGFG